jgi:hypothetical protein
LGHPNEMKPTEGAVGREGLVTFPLYRLNFRFDGGGSRSPTEISSAEYSFSARLS